MKYYGNGSNELIIFFLSICILKMIDQGDMSEHAFGQIKYK